MSGPERRHQDITDQYTARWDETNKLLRRLADALDRAFPIPEWQAAATRIRAAIDGAETSRTVAGIIQAQAATLETIAAANRQTYDWLLRYAEKRSIQLDEAGRGNGRR